MVLHAAPCEVAPVRLDLRIGWFADVRLTRESHVNEQSYVRPDDGGVGIGHDPFLQQHAPLAWAPVQQAWPSFLQQRLFS